MHDIWKKCPKTDDVIRVEQEVGKFLKEFNLDNDFNIDEIEKWIYDCKAGEEDEIFDPIINKIKSGNLADLMRFDDLFRKKLFSHVPQKILSGYSPIKYTLSLKKLCDS